MEKLLAATPPDQLATLFAAVELAEAGAGVQRAARLAACFAAKEACCKLFPGEIARGTLAPQDFFTRRIAAGTPEVGLSDNARMVLDRHRVATIHLSFTHTETSTSAMALAERMATIVPWFGRWLYHLIPYRRGVVLGNLRRVFGATLPETEIVRLAQAYYAHYCRCTIEFFKLPLMSEAQKTRSIRVENAESPLRAHRQGRGILLLTGHFGNWEVATVAGIQQFPEFKGQFHFVRRPLKPEWLNRYIARRFLRAGFGLIPKKGSLDLILDLLAGGAIVVYVFDQHAGGKDGVTVDFCGHPANTFKSPALIAMASGTPVIPAASWREPDGTHVLRFEEPLALVEGDDTGAAIRQNTQMFNATIERLLLRHPEQWIWMHRRWKAASPRT
jgi:KDO2-lipid IV(A) lauroyltransferase